MIIKKETQIKLNNLLRLPATRLEQDWDIELADETRLIEFLDLSESIDLSDMEKSAVIALILASYDDYIEVKSDTDGMIWDRITGLLDYQKTNCHDLLQYWGLPEEEDESEVFNITPLVRSYIRKLQRLD